MRRGVILSGIAVLFLFSIVSLMASTVYVEDDLGEAALAPLKVETARWVSDAYDVSCRDVVEAPPVDEVAPCEQGAYYIYVVSGASGDCTYSFESGNKFVMDSCQGDLMDLQVTYTP
jgi:hypothetical protein